LPAATAYDVQVRAVRSSGPFYSPWASVSNVTTIGKTATPNPPTGLAAVAGIALAKLTWMAPADADIAGYRIWQGTSSTFAAATLIGQSQTTNFTAATLANNTTYYFWAGSVDASGNASATQDGPVSVTTNYVQTGDIATGAVTAQSSAANSGGSVSSSNTQSAPGAQTNALNLASVTVTADGATTLNINVSINDLEQAGNYQYTVGVYLYRDGSNSGLLTIPVSDYGNIATFVQDTPAAGSHTYTIVLYTAVAAYTQEIGPTHFADASAGSNTLQILQFKR
jgi:predicted phage tail protein